MGFLRALNRCEKDTVALAVYKFSLVLHKTSFVLLSCLIQQGVANYKTTKITYQKQEQDKHTLRNGNCNNHFQCCLVSNLRTKQK